MKLTTKERLLSHVMGSLFRNTPVECSLEFLMLPFGFKRVSGEEYLIKKLLRPSATEESMPYLPKDEIIKNVISWAGENGIACCYNGNYSMNDSFTFYKFIQKQPK